MGYSSLKQEDFPECKFFTYLTKGVEYYQDGEYQRAIWEWFAASRLEIAEPLKLVQSDGPVQIKSNLKNISLLHFIYAIYLNNLSGVAQIEHAKKAQKLMFKKGLLCFMENVTQENRIGKYIMEKKQNISHDEMKKYLIESKKRKMRIGQCLLEKEVITQQELADILDQQIIEAVSESLFTRQGEVYFTQKQIKENHNVTYSPLKMAFKAAQRKFDVNNFRKEINDNKAIFRKTPYLGEFENKLREKLNTNELFVLSLIDGFRNIDQLVRFSGANEESIISILYRLSKIGLIRKIRESAEYEDKEFEEVSKILDLLFDIYNTLYSRLYRELGRKTDKMVVKALSLLDQDKQKLFENVPMNTPQQMQKSTILNNMAHYYPEPEKRFIFIEIFGDLFERILEEARKFLGDRITKSMTQVFRTTIANIECLCVNTSYSNQLHNTLIHILRRFS